MLRTNIFPLSLAVSALAVQPLAGITSWPLWNSYTTMFLEDSGRIVDHDTDDRTTSEGQAYALFFSLVGNDRPTFDRILSWTQTHLARGDLASNLPAWLWGNQQGSWQVIDNNSAADADLWMAYTLLEAGRLWQDPKFTVLGRALSNSIMQLEVVDIPGLGPMLLPGPTGFKTSDGWYQLNASYLPIQLLLGIAGHMRSSRWRQIADLVPLVVEGSSAKGFILDWIAYRPFDGFSTQPSPVSPPFASYDAIRVYLWAGTLSPATPGRERIFAASWGMSTYLEQNAQPPASVGETGQVTDIRGNVGFSAAVIPLLVSLKRPGPLQRQQLRLQSAKNARTGLYGTPPRYYDQNLALFSLGSSEKRFYFDEHGRLGVNWK
jgi:endo-1,4-beta-D-glucanase Y